jgi:hypothetical protein
MENEQKPGLLAGLSLRTLRRAYSEPASQLSEEEAASTLFRFFRSRHVVDLRLIVVTILGLLALYLVIIAIGALVEYYHHPEVSQAEMLIRLVGPAVGIAGLIVSWAYKSASTRLGIIDLFGCEIGTLCRVGTIFDVGTRYVSAYDGVASVKDDGAEKPDPPEKYTSQEDYFPIFDHNSKDLQLLEALVVCHITAFYTFMKATRDTQRRLATMPPPNATHSHEGASPVAQTPWHTTLLDVVYMVFLGYEAGRKAIDELVEFEPAAAENTIVILITELTCYGLLLRKLKEDHLRYPRLKLRQEQYRDLTPRLYREIEARRENEYWRPACELLPQLKERYEDALGETMEQALANLRRKEASAALAAPRSALALATEQPP